MSDGPVYIWWASRSHVYHWRSWCWVRRVGDHRERDLAVLALPKLRAKGMRPCAACVRAGALRPLEVADGDAQSPGKPPEGAGGRLDVAALPADDRALADQKTPGEFGLAPALRLAGRPDRLS